MSHLSPQPPWESLAARTPLLFIECSTLIHVAESPASAALASFAAAYNTPSPPARHSEKRSFLSYCFQDTSRSQKGKAIEILSSGKDLDTATGFQAQQIVVPGDDDFGVGLHRALKDHVVLGVAAHSL